MTVTPDKQVDQPRLSIFRNISVVSLHKAAQLVGQVVAVATIPRLLGADDHGRFAFVLSLGFLGQILGDFGTLEAMSRFVPTLTTEANKRLYMRTLVFKVIIGLLAALLTVGAAQLLANWMRFDWALLMGIGVLAHIIAWVPFHFLLGLNRVGLWMVEQSWRQWTLVALLLLLYPFLGLGGSLLAWTLMEVIFCVLGLWWTRHYWYAPEIRFDWAYLRPYVHFGFGFFLANLIGAALYRSGPVLVETLTGQSAEAGFLNLSIGLFLMPYLLLTQMAQSFVPTLSRFYEAGEHAQMQRWLDNFTRYSWAIGWLGTLGVWLLADWGVQFVFGADYTPAAASLKWISLGIPLSAILWTGNAVAAVTGQGRVKFTASLVALVVFALTAAWLTPAYAAAGTAIALTIAVAANVATQTILLRPHLTLNWRMLSASGAVGAIALTVIARVV